MSAFDWSNVNHVGVVTTQTLFLSLWKSLRCNSNTNNISIYNINLYFMYSCDYSMLCNNVQVSSFYYYIFLGFVTVPIYLNMLDKLGQ